MSTLAQRITDLTNAVKAKINLMTPRLLPVGGAVGQVLFKSGVADGAAGWAAPSFSAPKAATLTVPFPGAYEHAETIVDAAMTGSEFLLAWLAPAADDSDENDPEMIDLVALTADATAGHVNFIITFSQPVSGPIRVLYRNPASY